MDSPLRGAGAGAGMEPLELQSAPGSTPPRRRAAAEPLYRLLTPACLWSHFCRIDWPAGPPPQSNSDTSTPPVKFLASAVGYSDYELSFLKRFNIMNRPYVSHKR